MIISILDLLKERIVLLDGGMGTELMKHGLLLGACPESWNAERPEVIKKIHRAYFDAGADAVLTNSFGGNALKLSSHRLSERCGELNFEAAHLANEVKPEGKFVGGSMGPTGKFLKPQGEFSEIEFEEAFFLQAEGLAKGKADFLIIETMYDLREALCALRGARRASSLPIFVTMTFNRTPRGFFTLMGDSVTVCLRKLEENEVPVVGTNCTLDSADMADLIREMRAGTSLPLIAQPNAGQPVVASDGTAAYSQGIENYMEHIPRIIEYGARLIGGCCGTNPDYTRRMAEVICL